MRAIRTEAYLTSFRARSDRSLGFSGVTPELSSTEKVAFLDLQNVALEMVVFPKDEKDPDVLEVKKEMEGKTPCQRLRGCIFVLWKAEGEKEAFELYYSVQMEKIIEWIKRKIDGEKG
jgi:hypothetical protein